MLDLFADIITWIGLIVCIPVIVMLSMIILTGIIAFIKK